MAWVQYDTGPIEVLNYRMNWIDITVLNLNANWSVYGQIWPR